MQSTLKSPIAFEGVGLHTGLPARVVLKPASAEHGIWFRRTDEVSGDPMIPARWDAVPAAELCTKIVNSDGVSVSTIEHLMAAIAGTGLSNLLIEVEGPEIPILDGSSAVFVKGILSRGIQEQAVPVRAFRVLKPVEVRHGSAYARLDPAESLEIEFEIEFKEEAIGHQHKTLNMANGTFVHELCDSRTFCRQADVAIMREKGLALGGESGKNSVVFDGNRVLSPGGLRHNDEPVRHKMLDAMGDLALAGAPLLARYSGHKAGHAMTNALLRALFSDPSAFELVECDRSMVARLPGAGLTRRDVPALAA